LLYESFDIVLDGSNAKRRFRLSHLYEGHYVCPIMWGEIQNPTSGAACMLLASAPYDVPNYYCGYEVFLQALRGEV
jgi:hypothetical protein